MCEKNHTGEAPLTRTKEAPLSNAYPGDEEAHVVALEGEGEELGEAVLHLVHRLPLVHTRQQVLQGIDRYSQQLLLHRCVNNSCF